MAFLHDDLVAAKRGLYVPFFALDELCSYPTAKQALVHNKHRFGFTQFY